MDRSYLQKTFRQIVGEKGFTEYVKHPLELFRIISELGEKATRLGEFKKGIQSGAVPLEAGYSARAVTLDFAQAGTTAQAINTFIAFFNANIRGWGRMISSFKEHPIRTSAKVFLGITVPTILLWAVNHDDDRWKEIPQWQKDLFWIVFIGDNIYRIPKPFELGIIFGSFPERFLDWLVDKDPELLKNLAQNLMEAGSPGFIPTVGLPILEWMTNYSFFRGRAIIPESRKAMPPELQYTQWSSEVSKKLGELLKLPPAQIDNLLFAWTGGLGRYATDIMDGILKGTGISPDIPEPSPTLADLPVIKAFIVRSPYGSSSEAVNDFYDFLEKYEAGEKYLKEMLINNELEKFNKYKAAHPELFFFADFDSERYIEAIEQGETPKDVFYSSSARYLRRVASQLSEIWKKEDLIYKDPDMSPEEKRRLIDKLEILKTDIARKAVDLLQMKEPEILQEQINERVNRLGELIGGKPVLGLEADEYYDMPSLNREFKSIIESATVEQLQKLEGINPLAIAWVKKEGIEKTIEPILNKQIKDIDFNLREGVSFEDYYKSWQMGLIKDSPLDKLNKRQIALLRDYQASENKSAFLKTLSDEDRKILTANPQKDWLRSHPKENAQLAIWGQAPILTKETYTEFKRLVNELDIPDDAIPKLILPPETSIDTHFKREELVANNREASAEGQLLLLEDYLKAQEAGIESYAEWAGLEVPDKPLDYYKLQVDNAKFFDKLDEIKADDTLSDDEKRKAYAEVRATKVGNETFYDIESRIDAISKGTRDNPIAQELIDAHVKYRQISQQEDTLYTDLEAKLFLADNEGYKDFRYDGNLWSQPLTEEWTEADVARWRLLIANRDKETGYNAISQKYADMPDAGINAVPEGMNPVAWGLKTAEQKRNWLTRRDTQVYLEANPEYSIARDQIAAYEFGFTEQADIDKYVVFQRLPSYGSYRDRFMANDPDFYKAYTDLQIARGQDPLKWKPLEEIPDIEYDNLYEDWKEQFDKYESYEDPESLNFIRDADERARQRELMLFTPTIRTYSGVSVKHKQATPFALVRYKRDAYELLLPDDQLDTYVQWRKLQSEGKPEGWEDASGVSEWWEDDWFMLEHKQFHDEIWVKKLENEPYAVQRRLSDKGIEYLENKDGNASHTPPTRELGAKYIRYNQLDTQLERDQYRLDNLDLDEWGVAVGIWTKTMSEKRKALGITETEKFIGELEKGTEEWEKRLQELLEKAGRR